MVLIILFPSLSILSHVRIYLLRTYDMAGSAVGTKDIKSARVTLLICSDICSTYF